MKRAIIFANGKMVEAPDVVKDIQPDDVLIAADGGSHLCKELGLTPEVVIGDFDSLDEDELAIYRDKGIEIIQHPRDKDQTDLELAIALAAKRGIGEVYVIGALGNRWDMSISNILLIALPAFSNLKIHVVEGRQEFFILRSGEQATLDGSPGESISLMPLTGDARGITTEGLEYPLNNESLHFGSSRGVSNRFLEKHAQIIVKEGILLCILNRGREW